MSAIETYYSFKGNKLAQAFKKRNMESYYCETKEDALKKAIALIAENSVVSWGGSETIKEIGLIDYLKSGNYKCLDRADAKTQEEIDEIYIKALSSDYYLMSANAITQDGTLVNIDGYGNRISALIYGPKNVIVIAGMNKVEPNEAAAIARARNYAAPVNSIRLKKNTPCSSTGICYNCMEDDCICCNILVTRMSRTENRIKVILVGESLGF